MATYESAVLEAGVGQRCQAWRETGRAQADAFLRELAFVLKATHSVKSAMAHKAAQTSCPTWRPSIEP